MSLSKEVTQAMAKFQSCWKEGYHLVESLVISPENNIVSDFTGFTKSVVIQNGSNWRWNRSMCVDSINISEDLNISLQKLNSRASCKGIGFPTYKVWIVLIHHKTNPSPFYFVWCEKGEPLSLQDLTFLKPFISPRLAAAFHTFLCNLNSSISNKNDQTSTDNIFALPHAICIYHELECNSIIIMASKKGRCHGKNGAGMEK